MRILELHTLTSAQIDDLQALISELDPEITVTAEMLERAANASETHLFAAVDFPGTEADEGPEESTRHIIGCASLCVLHSPTGRKASIEDVVVGSGFRGQGIGRALMEHIIGFAQRELAPVDLNLTSRPERVAANELYRKMGLERRETNVYSLRINQYVG